MEDVKKKALAYEIAEALNDMKSIDVHIAFCRRYTEEHLRDILEYVLSRPDNEITSSRAAYYTYLVKRNGRNTRY